MGDYERFKQAVSVDHTVAKLCYTSIRFDPPLVLYITPDYPTYESGLSRLRSVAEEIGSIDGVVVSRVVSPHDTFDIYFQVLCKESVAQEMQTTLERVFASMNVQMIDGQYNGELIHD